MITVVYCVYMKILNLGLGKDTLHQCPVDLKAAAAGGNDINSGGRYHCNSCSGSSNTDDCEGLRDPTAEIVGALDKGRESSVSECSVEMDLEAGVQETKIHLSKSEKDCRICHLSLDATNQESGFPIELGCSCKDDLAAVHKQCAEAWFKIKGNKICEICGTIARNVAGANETDLVEQWNESNEAPGVAVAPTPTESRSFWKGHRFLNFLLACTVFAFVISWLFHFNIPS